MQDTHVVSTDDFAKALRELHLKEMLSILFIKNNV